MNETTLIETIAAYTLFAVPISFILHRVRMVEKTGTKIGTGARAVQFIGIGMILPIILIGALTGFLEKQTFGTLLGAMVGYLFANIPDFKNRAPKDSKK